MKKFITIIAVATFTMIINPVLAQTRTASPSSSPAPTKSTSKEIDLFKEKLAAKVAELSKKNQKAVTGVIEAKPDQKAFKIKNEDDGVIDVKFDAELTKVFTISCVQKEEEKIDILKKGDYVIVSGPLVDRVIDANFIYIDEQLLEDSGKVVAINSVDNTLDVTTLGKEKYTLDVTTNTKIQILNIKTLEVEKSGFSKIKEGDTVHYAAKNDPKQKSLVNAVRIFIIPQEYFIK